jgi:hypothetical protein
VSVGLLAPDVVALRRDECDLRVASNDGWTGADRSSEILTFARELCRYHSASREDRESLRDERVIPPDLTQRALVIDTWDSRRSKVPTTAGRAADYRSLGSSKQRGKSPVITHVWSDRLRTASDSFAPRRQP